MTPALLIIVCSVAIVWRVAGAWCRRDVDVEAMGFVEMERPMKHNCGSPSDTRFRGGPNGVWHRVQRMVEQVS